MTEFPILSDKDKADIVRQCAVWWDLTGRHLVRPGINEVNIANKVRAGNGMPTIVIKHAATKDLNDGILLGRKWDDLTKDEAARLVGAYITHKFLPERRH